MHRRRAVEHLDAARTARRTTRHETTTKLLRGVAACAIASVGIGVASAAAATHSHVITRWAPSGCSATGAARNEASGKLPPRAFPGYGLVYCNDFRGTELSPGWGKFDGVPGGDPSGMFLPSHVVVAGGTLRLNTYRDAAANGNWATGGLCQCSLARTYGAYFVRSRETAAGDDSVELLWPAAHVWPPEIDFNETGDSPTKTAWYVHFTSHNSQVRETLRINLEKWHTWGLIWTPKKLTFTVDGSVWGVVNNWSVIPHEAMTLDIQQQTWCGIAPECPSRPLSLLVDWVSVFRPVHR